MRAIAPDVPRIAPIRRQSPYIKAGFQAFSQPPGRNNAVYPGSAGHLRFGAWFWLNRRRPAQNPTPAAPAVSAPAVPDHSAMLARVIPATVMLQIYEPTPTDQQEGHPLADLFKTLWPQLSVIQPNNTANNKADRETLTKPPAPHPSDSDPRVNPERDRIKGSGSGFWIMCRDGKPRILTNAHVVKQHKPETLIMMSDPSGHTVVEKLVSNRPGMRKYQGVLNRLRTFETLACPELPRTVPLKIATNPRTDEPAVFPGDDLAVLEPLDDRFYRYRHNAFALPDGIEPLAFETDPSRMKPGQWVMKVGSTIGSPGNVAEGMISGFMKTGGPCSHFGMSQDPCIKSISAIETTAPLNLGDSGGPLVNQEGKVLGINFIRIDGNSDEPPVLGLGYAIAAPHVIDVLKKAWLL